MQHYTVLPTTPRPSSKPKPSLYVSIYIYIFTYIYILYLDIHPYTTLQIPTQNPRPQARPGVCCHGKYTSHAAVYSSDFAYVPGTRWGYREKERERERDMLLYIYIYVCIYIYICTSFTARSAAATSTSSTTTSTTMHCQDFAQARTAVT